MLFHYRVNVWDTNTQTERSDMGLLFAKDFSEAAEHLSRYYAENLDAITYLAPIADSDVVPITDAKLGEAALDNIRENWIW